MNKYNEKRKEASRKTNPFFGTGGFKACHLKILVNNQPESENVKGRKRKRNSSVKPHINSSNCECFKYLVSAGCQWNNLFIFTFELAILNSNEDNINDESSSGIVDKGNDTNSFETFVESTTEKVSLK